MPTDDVATTAPNPNDYRRGGVRLFDIADPQPDFRRMRDTCPVTVSSGIAFLTKHADVEAALRNPEVFASKGRGNVGNTRPRIPVDIDPPEHRRYRRILDPLFSPREMARFEPDFTALTNRLLDGFADRGRCDFATEFAEPLPSLMFLQLLGLPLEDLHLLLGLKDAVMRPPSDGDVAAHMAASGQRIYDYFEDHLAKRSTARGNDVISRIIDADVDGEQLTHEEVVDILYMFTLAGLDTVTASLECFIAYLATHPDQRRLIVDDPGLMPSAVEELLRWESPVLFSARAAASDVTVRGFEIKAGTPVAVLLASANTDEEAFERADVVDLAREPNRHIAFGRGIHRCLGSHLARLELRVALTEFHRRIPDYAIEHGVELAWQGPAIRAVPALPLTFAVGRSGA
jgi:cytochrome P450